MGIVLTAEEQIIWEKWISARDEEAGNLLVKKYMPLVSYHVQRVSVGLPRNVSRDDIHSLGLMGLYDALEKFDPTRDLKFDTYASFRIRGAIIDGLRKEDWLSRSTRDKAKKIDAAIGKLEQKLMRNVTAKDIASELNLTEEEVVTTMNEHFFSSVLSIDENPGEQEEKDGQNFAIKDTKAEIPEEKVVKDELIKEMAEMISHLNENEQLVLSLFYQEELTLTEIGQVMDLSTSRISQIHSKAIFKLRQSLSKMV
ncbi:FliA/WhiG family RNA polymerase sigma factor [Robertmurraya yapensis]|uniref:FliA/WhiG family RNA polymerase sigma factor n=2 Tax=Bacillaceae TaxID=186817 RepID=A0A431WJU7_9BACI|nr:FliA/WhiG family RNA polymerase sigma factor [Bacillus yapensis]RTR35603.1 FliA/WhiG family RNA polymerase sigma factor [Bacillus yapensis]TKS98404.1 FliA/WhiG family RNA polymerase sigma factor [Bacillus yapensis]